MTVVVNCLVKQITIFLDVVVILLLNVIIIIITYFSIALISSSIRTCSVRLEVLSVGGGAMLDRPCMVFQRMCVLWI